MTLKQLLKKDKKVILSLETITMLTKTDSTKPLPMFSTLIREKQHKREIALIRVLLLKVLSHASLFFALNLVEVFEMTYFS